MAELWNFVGEGGRALVVRLGEGARVDLEGC